MFNPYRPSLVKCKVAIFLGQKRSLGVKLYNYKLAKDLKILGGFSAKLIQNRNIYAKMSNVGGAGKSHIFLN